MKNNTTESIKSDILKRVNEDTLNSSIDISFEKKGKEKKCHFLLTNEAINSNIFVLAGSPLTLWA